MHAHVSLSVGVTNIITISKNLMTPKSQNEYHRNFLLHAFTSFLWLDFKVLYFLLLFIFRATHNHKHIVCISKITTDKTYLVQLYSNFPWRQRKQDEIILRKKQTIEFLSCIVERFNRWSGLVFIPLVLYFLLWKKIKLIKTCNRFTCTHNKWTN